MRVVPERSPWWHFACVLGGFAAGPLAAARVDPGRASLYAQEARPEDVSSIDGIIEAYYEIVSGPAGEASDVARPASGSGRRTGS